MTLQVKGCNERLITLNFTDYNAGWGKMTILQRTFDWIDSDNKPHSVQWMNNDVRGHGRLLVENEELAITLKKVRAVLFADYDYDFLDRRTMLHLVIVIKTIDIKKVRMLLGMGQHITQIKLNHQFQ
jgi:hypothetical protein